MRKATHQLSGFQPDLHPLTEQRLKNRNTQLRAFLQCLVHPVPLADCLDNRNFQFGLLDRRQATDNLQRQFIFPGLDNLGNVVRPIPVKQHNPLTRHHAQHTRQVMSGFIPDGDGTVGV